MPATAALWTTSIPWPATQPSGGSTASSSICTSTRATFSDALQDAHGDRYQPERDVSAWVAFCVEAHTAQVRQRLAQIEEAGVRWSFLEHLTKDRGWPDRLMIALEQSLIGGSDRASYSDQAQVSSATASGDFRRLLDAGLVVRRGRGRSIRYHASDALRADVATHNARGS